MHMEHNDHVLHATNIPGSEFAVSNCVASGHSVAKYQNHHGTVTSFDGLTSNMHLQGHGEALSSCTHASCAFAAPQISRNDIYKSSCYCLFVYFHAVRIFAFPRRCFASRDVILQVCSSSKKYWDGRSTENVLQKVFQVWHEYYSGADKSLARPGRKQATATEDFEFHISFFHCFTVHFISQLSHSHQLMHSF